MSKRFYITTAIDYVNGQPHLGHAYEKVISDVIARSHRSLGEDVFFLTGLDEHGQKVQQAAQAEGKTPQAYCDELAAFWQQLPKALDLSNDEFIRTSQPRHHVMVRTILNKLHAEGHFYKAEHSGFYSVRQETFLTEKDRLPDGSFDPIYGEVTFLTEENWYFKLGAHQDWLIQHIESNPDFILPSYRRNEVLGFLKNHTLEDLCISRPISRLNWGIPIPFDPAYVTYVWFDALVNYVTIPAGLGDPAVIGPLGLPAGTEAGVSLWPADVHVIGKDILKFHAVYWPIMLKTMGLPLPKRLVAHGFWQKDGEKISKTTGNIIDPIAVIHEWGLDAFRYYVTRELEVGPDGNWTDSGFSSRYRAELANGLGNLLNRSLSMLQRYRDGVVPPPSTELAGTAEEVCRTVEADLKGYQLQAALQSIWVLVNRANKYVEETAPFRLAKDPSKAARLDEVLYNLAESCRILAVLLWPIIPGAAEKIYSQLGLLAIPNRLSDAKWGGLVSGHRIGQPFQLFPLKDLPTAKTG